MDFKGFKLFPAEGRLVGLDEQRLIGDSLEAARLLDHFERDTEVIVEVGRRVPEGITLAIAHLEWNESSFDSILSPFGLPRQPEHAKTPPSLVHVIVSVIKKHTPGMGSHFGFEGYFLSLLFSMQVQSIWDARGENAV